MPYGITMEYKSKTEKKKDAIALQNLGEKLVKLPNEQLEGIDMPEELSSAVRQAKTIKSHGALKRQMQFIGTLMRKIDPAPVQEAIDGIEQGNYKKAMEFKETEKCRDELMAGNKELMDEILVKYPSADRQQLSQLVRNALKERKDNKPPKAFRALFRYLKEIKKSAI
jgi:ribosome-associated protein